MPWRRKAPGHQQSWFWHSSLLLQLQHYKAKAICAFTPFQCPFNSLIPSKSYLHLFKTWILLNISYDWYHKNFHRECIQMSSIGSFVSKSTLFHIMTWYHYNGCHHNSINKYQLTPVNTQTVCHDSTYIILFINIYTCVYVYVEIT